MYGHAYMYEQLTHKRQALLLEPISYYFGTLYSTIFSTLYWIRGIVVIGTRLAMENNIYKI